MPENNPVRLNKFLADAGLASRRGADALIQSGAETLRASGYQRIELGPLGSLSAYRVVHRHAETATVDRHLVDEPFLAEERGWHG